MCTTPPPSTMSRSTPRSARSSLSRRIRTCRPPSTTVATGPSRARASDTRGLEVYTSFSASPVVKKFERASRFTRSVTVIFIGDDASPRAVRSSRRACDRTSSRGLSVRTVAAPTMIASQDARTPSTRSKSAALDSARRGVRSPR